MRNTKYLLFLLFLSSGAFADISAEQINAQMSKSADFFSYQDEEELQDSVSTGNAGILKRELPKAEKSIETTESFQDLEKQYFDQQPKKIRTRE
ncbi:MAG: hypothetical protein CME62_10280 [Halobacteriovoraceae bacterium]|nr:hypothetical protein [Halobacteriovoraceae bacterium]|tara:strand:- start:2950 stop:3231 length:282 start_codon:yes stop_codon:yes gene_type:complete